MRLTIFGVSLHFITYSIALDHNDDLIIGGRIAYIEDFPFIVAILNNKHHLCGGSLLSTTHVLTACHCVVNVRHKKLTNLPVRKHSGMLLVVGSVNEKSDKFGARSRVRNLLKHPLCRREATGWVYDVGMAIASKQFPLVPGEIELAPLPNFKDGSLDKLTNGRAECVAAGWGKTTETSKSYSKYLLKVDLKLVPLRSCELRLNAIARNYESDLRFSPASQLCTIGLKGKDACQGDSGGPLVCEAEYDKAPILCAAVSWGFGCGEQGIPGVWARLDVAEPWIRSTLSGALCKRPTIHNVHKIIGGREARAGKYPFIVSIDRDGNHICGGSLLSAEHALTAGHCLLHPIHIRDEIHYELISQPETVIVSAGTVALNEGGTTRSARFLIKHPKCVRLSTGWIYDLGVVLVSKRFPLGYIQTLPLPNYYGKLLLEKMFLDEVECEGMGWGATDETSLESSSRLMEVDLQLLPLPNCSLLMTKASEKYQTDLKFREDTQVCTLGEDGKDACQGDSGGPLLCDNGFGKQTVIAVVSWGIGCGRMDTPGVWARLDVAEQWIREVLLSRALTPRLPFLLHVASHVTTNTMFHSTLSFCFTDFPVNLFIRWFILQLHLATSLGTLLVYYFQ